MVFLIVNIWTAFLIFSKKQCWDSNCCRCGMDPSSCPLWLLLWTYWCLGLVQAGSVSSFKISGLVVDMICIQRSKTLKWIYHDHPRICYIQELLDVYIPFSFVFFFWIYIYTYIYIIIYRYDMCDKLVPSPPHTNWLIISGPNVEASYQWP